MADSFKKYSEATLKSKSRYDLIGIIETGYLNYDKDRANWKNSIRQADELTISWMKKAKETENELEETKKALAEANKKLDALAADPSEQTKTKGKGGRPRRYDNEARQKVADLNRAGMSVREIAKVLKMSPATVGRIVKALPSKGPETAEKLEK